MHIPEEPCWARAQDTPSQLCLAGVWGQGMCGLTAPLISWGQRPSAVFQTLNWTRLFTATWNAGSSSIIPAKSLRKWETLPSSFPACIRQASTPSPLPSEAGLLHRNNSYFKKKSLQGLVGHSSTKTVLVSAFVPNFFFLLLFFSNDTMHWELWEEEAHLDNHEINKWWACQHFLYSRGPSVTLRQPQL